MLNIKHNSSFYRESGFSLIELMLAMVIGLVIMGGVMQLFITTRDTQRTSEDQLQLISDARFVMQIIGFDLRHAGFWGANNNTSLTLCGRQDPDVSPCPVADQLGTIPNDCEGSDWYIDTLRPVMGSNDSNTFSGTCATQGYQAGTDVLGVHYADTIPIPTASLAGGVVYVRSNVSNGQLFVGPAYPPTTGLKKWIDTPLDTFTRNFPFKSHVYYVSDYTNDPAENPKIPSLHRVELSVGPQMEDRVLIPGVEDFQLEYGLDTSSPKDYQVNTYVNADNVTSQDWLDGNVIAVKIWLLMRAERADRDGVGGSQTFTLAGKPSVTYNDGIRRFLMTSVVRLRNTSQVDKLESGS